MPRTEDRKAARQRGSTNGRVVMPLRDSDEHGSALNSDVEPSGVRLLNRKVSPHAQDIDLAAWTERPGFLRSVRDYFEQVQASMTPVYRASQLESLNVFREFLDAACPGLNDPEEVTVFVLHLYIDWLNKQKNRRRTGDDGEPAYWTDSTKVIRYRALVRFLDFAGIIPGLRNHGGSDLKLPINPWPRASKDIKSHEPLSDEDLVRIRRACIADMRRFKRRLAYGAKVLADESIVIPPVGEPDPGKYRDPRVKLRTLAVRHAASGPSPFRVKATDEGLALALGASNEQLFRFASYMHFTAATLVPFVLLLDMEAGFNPETILSVTFGGIKRENALYGQDRWTMTAEKRRSGETQRRSFWSRAADDTSVVQLLKTLEEFGASARSQVEPAQRDQIFAYWNIKGERAFATFTAKVPGASEKNWQRALAAFRHRHGLPHFTLVNIRATAAALVDEESGGDLKAVQRFLGHKRLSTTETSYRSTVAKRKAQEALATAIDMTERRATTNAASEPRRGSNPARHGGAVTAGFRCADPLFSPRPGQAAGRPCDDYGACPSCELAFVDGDDPVAFRRLVQLKEALLRASAEVHPQRWLTVWQPRLAAVTDTWLPKFSAAAVEAASGLHVPPILRIE